MCKYSDNIVLLCKKSTRCVWSVFLRVYGEGFFLPKTLLKSGIVLLDRMALEGELHLTVEVHNIKSFSRQKTPFCSRKKVHFEYHTFTRYFSWNSYLLLLRRRNRLLSENVRALFRNQPFIVCIQQTLSNSWIV